MPSELTGKLIDKACGTILAHAEELTSLDQAIGDGDHGLNMKRGFEAIAADRSTLEGQELWPAVQKAGMTLVMKVGGASGPLYGSLFMSMGKAEGSAIQRFRAGVEAVKSRGKSDIGAKTMLDVLVPTLEALEEGANLEAVRKTAKAALENTRDMKATKGRASFLGDRSIGHLDPGARSSQLLITAVCELLEEEA
ncbi:MAG: dihydroxyacetone kinase subunit DhaL [Kiloniellales bacterium]|nr:dihydroxyacetone kinase subunit DhaL [Kiloniellales bacterium]